MFDYMAHTESYDMDVTSYIWRCIDMQWRNVIFCIFINWVIRRERKKLFFCYTPRYAMDFICMGKYVYYDSTMCEYYETEWISNELIFRCYILWNTEIIAKILFWCTLLLCELCVCECWMIILWYNGKTLWCHASYNNNGITIIIEMCFTFYNTEFWFKFIKWFLFHILYTFRNTIIKKNAII